jgi:enediyne biosynthesis protein E4
VRAASIVAALVTAALAACSTPSASDDSASNPDTASTGGGATVSASATPPADTIPPSSASGVIDPECWAAAPQGGDGVGFDDATADLGLVEPLTGMYGHATAAADVNADGWTDLFVSGFADRPVEDYQVRGADGPAPDRVLLGGPNGFAVDESFPGELARTSGATFADLDDDGDLDLVVVRNPRDDDDDVSRRPSAIYERDGTSWRLAGTFAADVGGRSVAAIDVDRDGLVDLAVAGDRFGAGPSRLYRNEGDLTFSDATDDWGMPDDMTGLALATIDLDGDGWLDLVVSGDERVLLGGEGGFTVASQPLLRWETFGEEDDPAGIAVGDLDGDFRPDLVVGQHFNSTLDDGREVPIRVFLNRAPVDGDTSDVDSRVALEEVTESAGVVAMGTKSPHVAVVDVDGDGHLDIVTSAVADDGSPIVLRNSGDDELRFEAVGEPGDGSYWVTGATDDFDHDGRLDVFMVAWEPASPSVAFRGTSTSGHWIEVALDGTDLAAGTRVEAAIGDRRWSSWAQSTTGYAAGAANTVRFGLGDTAGDTVDITVTPLAGEPTELRVPLDSRTALGVC